MIQERSLPAAVAALVGAIVGLVLVVLIGDRWEPRWLAWSVAVALLVVVVVSASSTVHLLRNPGSRRPLTWYAAARNSRGAEAPE
ncbi:hypothetical protein GIS00_16340 [Nakamurella sp. YIM 132087]|uniref:Uncharacterized protein n=1 Tax=Nakamurella alba TaxID=2665158 RepID=A0A7K1FMZ7_9ACTN|nr:hypothetical protein [Nakamurella alba]MTD15506.1 hypothetical protein [Nakamurella alba]